MSDETSTPQAPEQGCRAATHEEICNAMLRHYQDVSAKACSWMNTVERAIAFYRKYGPTPQAPTPDFWVVQYSYRTSFSTEYIKYKVFYDQDDAENFAAGVDGELLPVYRHPPAPAPSVVEARDYLKALLELLDESGYGYHLAKKALAQLEGGSHG